jgi:hypothetical protein
MFASVNGPIQFSKIRDKLATLGFNTQNTLLLLKKHKIRHVVNAT